MAFIILNEVMIFVTISILLYFLYYFSYRDTKKEDKIVQSVAFSLIITALHWGFQKLTPETENAVIKLVYVIGEMIVLILLICGVFMKKRNHKTKTYKKVNEME